MKTLTYLNLGLLIITFSATSAFAVLFTNGVPIVAEVKLYIIDEELSDLSDNSFTNDVTILANHSLLAVFINNSKKKDAVIRSYVNENPYQTELYNISGKKVEKTKLGLDKSFNPPRKLNINKYARNSIWIPQGRTRTIIIPFKINEYFDIKSAGSYCLDVNYLHTQYTAKSFISLKSPTIRLRVEVAEDDLKKCK
jgi:hypothetical protein